MRRITRIFAAAALCLALRPLAALEAPGASAGPFVAGRWSGVADLGEGFEEIVVRVVEAAGEGGRGTIALVDLPARSLFGYPAELLERGAEGMSFSIAAAGPAGGAFSFRGSPMKVESGQSFSVEGRVSREAAAAEAGPGIGVFLLALSPDPGRGESRTIPVDGGALAGSLALPDSALGWNVPAALILSGAGEADRDGDNYNVPGKPGSLSLLARELASRGVASLRYDKRGVGESLASAPEAASFDDYVADAERALRELIADPRFSRIVVVGHAEGALVGAAALARFGPPQGSRLAGLASLCASGLSPADALRRDLRSSIEAGFPDLGGEERAALAARADAVVDALERGESCGDPGPELASFFDPAAQAYYAAALKYDLGREAASTSLPLLVVAGGSDLQVPPEEAAAVLSARPDAAYRVIAGMAHSLKAVGDDEEANYGSFANPDYPLGEGLADLVAAFARGERLPGPVSGTGEGPDPALP